MIKYFKSFCLLYLLLGYANAHAVLHQRIVSLAPDVTEILFAIGGGDLLVGVIKGCDYPKHAKKIPIVGSYQAIDIEKIISLHPDLIISWGGMFSRQLEKLKQLGIAVYVTHPRDLQDVLASMTTLGTLIEQRAKSAAVARHFSMRLAELSKHKQNRKPLRVFYQIGPTMLTVNQHSWINQVITLCGGENIAAKSFGATPQMSEEALLVANPQVIINGSYDDQWKLFWQHRSAIEAVQKNHLLTINPDLLERAGPRLIEGASQLCAYIQAIQNNAS